MTHWIPRWERLRIPAPLRIFSSGTPRHPGPPLSPWLVQKSPFSASPVAQSTLKHVGPILTHGIHTTHGVMQLPPVPWLGRFPQRTRLTLLNFASSPMYGGTRLPRPDHGKCGICLMNPEDFRATWVGVKLPISADEMSIVVWPPTKGIDDIDCDTESFPVKILTDKPSVTLLRGQVFHLGAKKISICKDANDTAFQSQDACSMMVEIEQNTLDRGNWDLACKNPIGFTRNAVGTPILSHWGIRFWDNDNRATSKEKAIRATLNILVAETDVPQCLKASGRNVWISPRNGQEVFTQYRPVWLQMSLAEVRIQHDRLAHSAGIVKGRSGFAIRTHLEHWRKFARPYSPVPHPNPTWVLPRIYTSIRSVQHP